MNEIQSKAKARILSSVGFTIPGTFAIIGGAYWAGIGAITAELSAPEQVAFSLRWLVIAIIPYAAVCIYILQSRLNEGAHNPIEDKPSVALAIHCRVMQNHLEQFVWFGTCLVALASLLHSNELHLVPILAVYFCLARFIYWWGYLQEGTTGRRYGVQMTFGVTIPLLLGVLGLIICR